MLSKRKLKRLKSYEISKWKWTVSTLDRWSYNFSKHFIWNILPVIFIWNAHGLIFLAFDEDDLDGNNQQKRKFVVVNNGWPINPDYQILKDVGNRPSTSVPKNTFGTRYSLANINPVSPFNGGSAGGCNAPFHKECAVATNW